MAEYEPLDLTDLCNISAEVLGEDALARLGAQTYRGLPFTIGNASTGQDVDDGRATGEDTFQGEKSGSFKMRSTESICHWCI